MITTFYSFKGGVGRTLALANVGTLLSENGAKVLLVDFDLEAPGLSRYIENISGRDLSKFDGLIDLLEMPAGRPTDLDTIDRNVIRIAAHDNGGTMDLVTCGRQDQEYIGRVLGFDWKEFFAEREGGAFFEFCRDEWFSRYDHVLIDSRTGITDAGGVCTIMLPDVIVPVFTASRQSVDGVIDILHRAQEGRRHLGFDRPPAAVVPVPSRFDTRTEYTLAQEWMTEFSERFEEFYRPWLPKDIPVKNVLERTKLPYVAYFSFGEKLPVAEESGSDPESLSHALRTLAHLLESGLTDTSVFAAGIGVSEDTALDSLIDKAEARLRRISDIDMTMGIFARLVRIPSGEIAGSAAAASIFENGVGDPAELSGRGLDPVDARRFVETFPIVQLVDGSLRWRDPRVISKWSRLASYVIENREFLEWAQRVRQIANSSPAAYLKGPELGEALSWLQSHGHLMIAEERDLIEFSRDIRREKGDALALKPKRLLTLSSWRWGLVAGLALGIVSALSNKASFDGLTVATILLFGILGSAGGMLLDYRHLSAQRAAIGDVRADFDTNHALRARRDIAHQLTRFGYEAVLNRPSVVYFRLQPASFDKAPRNIRKSGIDPDHLDVTLEQHERGSRSILSVSGPRDVIRQIDVVGGPDHALRTA